MSIPATQAQIITEGPGTVRTHDVYIKRIGFSLIRVHRFQQNRVTVSTDQLLLSQMKWPIETICVGLRPAYNVDDANPNQYRDWHNLTRVTDNLIDVTAKSHSEIMIDNGVAFGTAGALKTGFSQESVEHVNFPVQTETIDTLKMLAHGITIFDTYKAAFYRDYMSYTFGAANIISPEDKGALLLNFCLYPGTYQPSGHINVSRAREFYLEYHSSYTSPSTPADMMALAKALNFLLISDGSAVVRYST